MRDRLSFEWTAAEEEREKKGIRWTLYVERASAAELASRVASTHTLSASSVERVCLQRGCFFSFLEALFGGSSSRRDARKGKRIRCTGAAERSFLPRLSHSLLLFPLFFSSFASFPLLSFPFQAITRPSHTHTLSVDANRTDSRTASVRSFIQVR